MKTKHKIWTVILVVCSFFQLHGQDNCNELTPDQLIIDQQNPTCGNSDGSLMVVVFNDAGSYMYRWLHGPVSPFIDNLSAGTYQVDIETFGEYCPYTLTFELTEEGDCACSAQSEAGDSITACGGTDIQLNATSPDAGYTGQWIGIPNSAQVSPGVNDPNATISNLGQGTYQFYWEVTDDNNPDCSIRDKVGVLVADPIEAFVMAFDVEPCIDSDNGAVEMFSGGGIGNLTVVWSDNFIAEDRNGLPKGDYSFVITDEIGCNYSDNVTIGGPDSLKFNEVIGHISCKDMTNGSIDISPTGGSGNYEYLWNTGEETEDISDLDPGDYQLIITHGNGSCKDTLDVEIEKKDTLKIEMNVIQPSCMNPKGEINTVITGGTGFFLTYWNEGDYFGQEDISDLQPGKYTVHVIDGDGVGCEDSATVEIIASDPILITEVITNASCNEKNDGSIDITPIGGNRILSYLWEDLSTNEDRTNLSGGQYEVTVTDESGCSVTETYIVDEPDVNEIEVKVSHIECYGFPTGSINVNVLNDPGTFSYLWSNNETTPKIKNLAAGEYTLIIDDNTACKDTLTLEVEQVDSLKIDVLETIEPSCYNSNDGEIKIEVSGGIGFSYGIVWFQVISDEAELDNLSAGDYTVMVFDQVGDVMKCQTRATITLNNPDSISILGNVGNVSCGGEEDGFIDITASGGEGELTYLWSNASTEEDLLSISGGTYEVTVTDENGCSKTKSFTVEDPEQNDIQVFKSDIVCYGMPMGSINVKVNNDPGTFLYEWNNGETTPSIINLFAGEYTLVIDNNTGCLDTVKVEIEQPDSIKIDAQVIHPTCYGSNNGEIKIEVSGGNGFYEISWNELNLFDETEVSNLPAGEYTIQIAEFLGDIPFCFVDKTITLTQPDSILILDDIGNVSCGGEENGFIDITATGGEGQLSYLWSNLSTDEDLLNISGGDYELTITDENGCSKTKGFTVEEPKENIIEIIKEQPACFGESNGRIAVNVLNDHGSFLYKWIHGPLGSELINIPAGEYSLEINNHGGCLDTVKVELTQPDSFKVQFNSVNPTCYGINDGEIEAIIINNDNLLFGWKNPVSTNTKIENLPADQYIFYVGNSSCYKEWNIELVSPDSIKINENINHVSCNGEGDGSIEISAIGGEGLLTYLWEDQSTNEDRNNLSGGDYNVTATDENGCFKTKNYLINEPEQNDIQVFKSDIVCYGMPMGSINVKVNNDPGTFNYEWSNGETTPSIINLFAGEYTLVVDNNTGCLDTVKVEIEQPDSIKVEAQVIHPTCYGSNDGEIKIEVSGGNGFYEISWNELNLFDETEVSNLAAGEYTIQIAEFLGDIPFCFVDKTITLIQPDSIKITENINQVSCNGEGDGSIDISALGGKGLLTYLWEDQSTNEDRSNLSEGGYNVTVTDENGCFKTKNYLINEPKQNIIEIEKLNPTCFGASNGEIKVNVINDNGSFQYNWTHGESGPILTGITSGEYTLQISNSSSCSETINIELTQPSQLLLETSEDNVVCSGSEVDFSAIASGGIAPYSYVWNNTRFEQNITETIFVNSKHRIVVTDANNCRSKDSVEILIKDLSEFINAGNDTSLCAGDQISLNAESSILNINWKETNSISNINSLQPTVNPIVTTKYYLSGIDECGGEITDSVLVTVRPVPTVDLSSNKRIICTDSCLTLSNLNMQSDEEITWYLNSDSISNEQTFSYCPSTSDNHLIHAKVKKGKCSITTSEKELFSVTKSPIANFEYFPFSDIKEDELVEFSNRSEDALVFTWIISNQESSNTFSSLDLNFNYEIVGNYKVTLIANNQHCIDTITKQIKVFEHQNIFIPNAFTPNGNNLNEIFKPVIIGYPNSVFELQIFNRWGEILFTSNNPEQGWDGTFNGKECQMDTYIWKIKMNSHLIDETKQLKGKVSLIR